MSGKTLATLYYDIISPFAYLYVKQRQRACTAGWTSKGYS